MSGATEKITLSKGESSLNRLKRRMSDTSFEGIMWFLNALPKVLGYYVLGDKINIYYWICHLAMVFYIYVAGCVMYQLTTMANRSDFLKNYVNIILTAMILNISYWFLTKRQLLKEICRMVKINDELVRDVGANKEKHEKLLKRIKYIMIIFAVSNVIDDLVYQTMTQRIDPNRDYGIVNCIGFNTRTKVFDKHLCRALLLINEANLLFLITYYHLFYLFLMSHTAAIFDLLAEELIELREDDEVTELGGYDDLKNRFHTLIKRHGLTMQTCSKLKELYSTSIGIDFIVNASSICIVCFVPLEDLHLFAFVTVHSIGFLFVICYLGQRLTTAAEYFERAVYISDWNNFRPKEQKKIFTMLIQAQFPVVLLAADIVPVRIYTFAQTIQAVYKLFTVVKF